MELFQSLAASDANILERIQELDLNTNLEDGFLTCRNKPFILAEFIYTNLQEHEDLCPFISSVHQILWIACRFSHDQHSGIKQEIQTLFIKDLHNLLFDFIVELSETIHCELPSDDRQVQLSHFAELLQFEHDIPTSSSGYTALCQFKKSIRGLSFVPVHVFALPFFLQVHINCASLISHSYVARICRKPLFSSPHHTCWIHILEFIQSNEHILNVHNTDAPQVLTHFHSLFQDISVPLKTRCLQLFTIYHPEWRCIWTLIGWKCNRFETVTVCSFLHDFPEPFYQDTFLNDFFHVFHS
jgi:hypothetical protein